MGFGLFVRVIVMVSFRSEALDVGKAIGLMKSQERPLWDFVDVGDNWTRVNPDGVAVWSPCRLRRYRVEVGRASVIIRGKPKNVLYFILGMLQNG